MSGRALHLVGQTLQAETEADLDISENELIQALTEAQRFVGEERDGFMTAKEIGQVKGWSKAKVSAELHDLHDAGRLETRRVVMVDISGRHTRVPAYRLKS